MLSYDEAVKYRKRYRYKTDSVTNTKKIYDSETRTFIDENNDEIKKIKAAFAITQIIFYKTEEYSGLAKGMVPYNTEAEELEWKRKQTINFQENIFNILSSGNYSIQNDKLNFAKIKSMEEIFFEQLESSEASLQESKKQAEGFMEYVLDVNGKKLVNYNFKEKMIAGGMKRCVEFSFETKEKSFSEKLKADIVNDNEIKKKIELTPEQKANRRNFVEKLMATYLMAETDELYKKRVEFEEGDMKYAADTINHSKTIPDIKSHDVAKIIRLLLAAQNLNLEGQKDYLEEILEQPAVNQVLLSIKKDGTFEKLKSYAQKNELNGTIINGKLQGHHETKGELGRRLANRAIQRDPTFYNRATEHIKLHPKFKVKEQSDVIALSAIARTQGKKPSFKENDAGTFDFNSDENIVR